MKTLKSIGYAFLFFALCGAALRSAPNMIDNGFGELGTNEFFTNFHYDHSDYPVGLGAFRAPSSGYNNLISNHRIPISGDKSLYFSFFEKSIVHVSNNRNYFFISYFDIDQNLIQASHRLFVPGTTTVLTQPISNGDTVVHLADVSSWQDSSLWYRRGLSIWNYVDSRGFEYPPETYTRNLATGPNPQGLWDHGQGIDYANNRITLRDPWAGGYVPSGTSVSQRSSGGTYHYQIANYQIASEWSQREGIVRADEIWPGTAYVAVGWLTDYTQVGNLASFAGINLKELDNRLDVNGTIRAKEVIVESDWADYVFDEGYELMPLDSVEAHIREHHRLPGVPSAAEVAEAGVSLADSQRLLLEKVEELTLYAIEKDKRVTQLERSNQTLKARLAAIEATLQPLEN